MKKPAIRRGLVRDLTPDPHNANTGSSRGSAMLERSLRTYGAGRSVVVDKKGVVIGGNKTMEAAAAAGLTKTLIVQTDGTELVVVQRNDLDLATDAKAKELAIADNRTGEVSLTWNPKELEAMRLSGAEVEQFFRATEWDELMQTAAAEEFTEDIPEMALQPFEEYNYLVVVCKTSPDWQGLCDKLGIRREVAVMGKTRKIGLGRVIAGGALLEKLK